MIRNAEGVRAKFGVAPEYIPDYLALVGDAADGFPGITGYGPKTAASLINRHGPIEKFPLDLLKENLKDKKLPEGWESWKKTSADWAANTTALTLAAEKETVLMKLR